VADLQPEKPSISPEMGIELLRKQDGEWNFVRFKTSERYNDWRAVTRLCIEKAFGKNHPNIEEFLSQDTVALIDEGRVSQLRILYRFIEELELEIATRPTEPATKEVTAPAPSKKIFIVHGHNGELKEATARLVQKLNLEPVILHEQVKQGRPIIENFSIHAKASGFAIVLLTADDVGSLGSVEQHAALQPRARQNVVFEMGFFFGLLGQGRVCAIYDVGVEMPSDLGGILYVPYDAPSGRWRWDVAKEIQAAGYDIDLNKL
jgi:predicted nucleotide-binding protein